MFQLWVLQVEKFDAKTWKMLNFYDSLDAAKNAIKELKSLDDREQETFPELKGRRSHLDFKIVEVLCFR